jgi:hypothetical protein
MEGHRRTPRPRLNDKPRDFPLTPLNRHWWSLPGGRLARQTPKWVMGLTSKVAIALQRKANLHEQRPLDMTNVMSWEMS